MMRCSRLLTSLKKVQKNVLFLQNNNIGRYFLPYTVRNYVVIFHAPEPKKKKLTAEEEELLMELGDEEEEGEDIFSEEPDNFGDVRYNFSTISYDNYVPGGNEIRNYLNKDSPYHDGGSENEMTAEDQQEINAAVNTHGCDENYGYRKEHEKRKEKRKRIANRRRGLKSSLKVHALITYLKLKEEYTTIWDEEGDEDEDEEENDEDILQNPAVEVKASTAK